MIEARQQLTVDEAIARLAVAIERCGPCGDEFDEFGEVRTPHSDHPPRRRTVHSISVGGMVLGADWDEDGVHDWLRRADHIVDTNGWMGHGVAAHAIDEPPRGVHNPDDYRKPRWYAFETRKSGEGVA